MKNLRNLLLFSTVTIYEEILFSFIIFNSVHNITYKILFSIIFSIVLYMLTNVFNKNWGRIFRNLLILLITILFSAQFVYYQIYQSIISVYSMSSGGQVFQFWQTILEIIIYNWNKILLLLYPNMLYIGVFLTNKATHKNRYKKVKFNVDINASNYNNVESEKHVFEENISEENIFEKNVSEKNISEEKDTDKKNTKMVIILNKIKKFYKNRLKSFITCLELIVILQVVVLLRMSFENNDDIYSTKNLYTKTHVPTLMADKLGIITTMRLDFARLFTRFNDTTILAVNNNFEEVTSEKIPEYNMLNIDWNNLIENEQNETIKFMHEYFSNQEPTKKNDYTGMFKGKNVVVFVAESFNEVAIDEQLTPTLYKLYNQGFQFDNFYTPLFPVSTSDGEYITDTSLIPKENIWSLSKVSENYMPYSYANVFENLGYTSHAYHNHSATYYDRNEYLQGVGYDSYIAVGTGLEERMDCNHWPNSDLDMINATVDDYINDEHFLAYYMTVSGHLEYNTGGNYIANKNWNLVKDLPYSDKAKCYMATQIELDKAVEALIKKLENAGRLDDTVIVMSGDHYPYGLTLEELNELSDYEKDDNFEKHRMPFLIWNSQMSNPIKVDKIGASLDVLPTVLNLFGVEFDSRLLMGRDLLSDAESLVIFSNRSFITKKGRYNSLTKSFYKNDLDNQEDTQDINNNENKENKEDSQLNMEEYINEISKVIYNKYQISRLILENDYYRILFNK